MGHISKIANDYRFRQMITGVIIGSILAGLFVTPQSTDLFLDSIQKIVLICGTLFTAYWTSKTFTYNPKREEAIKISDSIKLFLDNLSQYESMSPLLETLSNQEFIDEASRKHWKERVREINRKAKVSKQILFEVFLSSNYSQPQSILAAGYLPTELSDLKEKKDYDELRKKLWKYDLDLRKEAFFTIQDEIRNIKRFFGF